MSLLCLNLLTSSLALSVTWLVQRHEKRASIDPCWQTFDHTRAQVDILSMRKPSIPHTSKRSDPDQRKFRALSISPYVKHARGMDTLINTLVTFHWAILLSDCPLCAIATFAVSPVYEPRPFHKVHTLQYSPIQDCTNLSRLSICKLTSIYGHTRGHVEPRALHMTVQYYTAPWSTVQT